MADAENQEEGISSAGKPSCSSSSRTSLSLLRMANTSRGMTTGFFTPSSSALKLSCSAGWNLLPSAAGAHITRRVSRVIIVRLKSNAGAPQSALQRVYNVVIFLVPHLRRLTSSYYYPPLRLRVRSPQGGLTSYRA